MSATTQRRIDMGLRGWVAAAALAVNVLAIAQTSKANRERDPNESVWMDAEITRGNLYRCIQVHQMDGDAMSGPQQPEDKVELPPPTVDKDGILIWAWPAGLHARVLMEKIRQGLHILTSSQTTGGMDGLAINQARAVWPKLRDIYCHAVPKSGYYDLDGIQRYCPEKPKIDMSSRTD
jgi:hypothetical protein